MWNMLFGKKAPDNEHLIQIRIMWGLFNPGFIEGRSALLPERWMRDTEEWQGVDSLAWRRIIQSIEGELRSEETAKVRKHIARWFVLMMACMFGLILGFMLGFLMSFLGCTDGNTGVCVTGLTFAGVFVCSLVCMVTGFFGLNVSVGRYGNTVFERIQILVPQLAASNPNMKLDIINVQIGNGPAQFDLKVTLRKPGESVETQERIPQKPQVPTSPISADLVALPKALPTNWVNQDISAGHFRKRCDVSGDGRDMFQILLDQTFKAKSTRDRQGQLPRRLRVVKCHRVEDSALWSTYMMGLEGLRSKFPQGCTSIRHHYTAGAASPEAHGGSVATSEVLSSLPVLDGKINEFYLLHGTSPGGALGITDGGFRLDFSGSHAGSMFGKGAYFSECSSKADEYSTDGEGIYEGVFAMILCRVACGELLRMLRPDSRAVEQALAGKMATSVLGDREASVGTYREFVVFDSTQIYPEYVILYEREF